jgi:ribosomal-protein-serine acetyltransferase
MARHLSTKPRFTSRLVLRPFRRRDVGPLEDAVRASLGDLQPWLPWANGYDKGVAQRFVRESLSAWNDGRAYDFAIRYPDEPDYHVGNVSIWYVSPQNRIGEVGYWIRSGRTDQGIGTEATARILQIGFEELNMHKIVLRIAAGNLGSERIAAKLGFSKEGLLREEVKVGTTWLDHTIWSLLENEWWVERDRLKAEGTIA